MAKHKGQEFGDAYRAERQLTNVAYTQSVSIHDILATLLTRRQSPRQASVGSSCVERGLPHDVCASCYHAGLDDPVVCQWQSPCLVVMG